MNYYTFHINKFISNRKQQHQIKFREQANCAYSTAIHLKATTSTKTNHLEKQQAKIEIIQKELFNSAKTKFFNSFRKYSLGIFVFLTLVTYQTLPESTKRPQILARNRLEPKEKPAKI